MIIENIFHESHFQGKIASFHLFNGLEKLISSLSKGEVIFPCSNLIVFMHGKRFL